jgi:hypothetical protein
MRASTAYFVGGGTMIAAIALGLGGGIVAGNIMNPVAPKIALKHGADSMRTERRAEPVAAMSAPTEGMQYLTGSQAFGAVVAAPAQAEAQSVPAKSEAPAAQSTETAAATEPRTPTESKTPAETAKPAEQQASADPAASVDNAYAKARDSDVKRAASERRRMERRQRWAERRHYDGRERTDWDDVARNVREDSEARDYGYRSRPSFPQIRLFGRD